MRPHKIIRCNHNIQTSQLKERCRVLETTRTRTRDVAIVAPQLSQSDEWRHLVVTVKVSRRSARGWAEVYVDGGRVGRGRLDGTYSDVV